MNRRFRILAVVAFAGAALIAPATLAGPLTPPNGPVTSTYKTLNQVEPRIPISTPTSIFTPGSYYLTNNLDLSAGVDGIRVFSENVTLDLNGFTISGGRTGVFVDSGLFAQVRALTILNGTISGASGSGIFAGGLDDYPQAITVRNVKVLDTADIAINVGRGGIVENCYVSGATTGIRAGYSSRVSGCVVEFADSYGYFIGGGSTVTDCVAVGVNNGSGGGDGFRVGAGSTVRGITSRSNSGNGGVFDAECNITDSTFTNNVLSGIMIGSNSRLAGSTVSGNFNSGVVLGATGAAVNCVVEHCDISTNLPLGIASFSLGNHTLRDNTISRNADFGIRVADNCQILNNRIAENGDNNNDGGVVVTGSGNIVQGNHFSLNSGSGVELYNTSSGNLVLANTFRGATVRVAGSGQTVAPVTAAGAAVTGTNSLVNIAY